MNSQFALLTKRRFLPMFIAQFLGAFNDNFFKQALLLLLTYQGAKSLGMSISLLNNLAALLFILPFFLFSSTAGQLADHMEKARLTQYIKLLEVCIALFATLGFVTSNYFFLLIALFLLGTQSAFFGPIKYAYLPDALKSQELIGANGLFQGGTSLSILLGMIAAGLLLELPQRLEPVVLSATVLSVAAVGFVASLYVPKTGATSGLKDVDFRIWRTTAEQVKVMWRTPAMFYVLIGVSWFWFYGATLLTQIPEVTLTYVGGTEKDVIGLLMLFLVGVVTGSLICKPLTKGKISLKLLPVALIGLTLFTLDTSLSLSSLTPAQGGSLKLYLDLVALGFFGGLYIVPLYSFMQGFAEPERRARVIAANNILNALFMVLSAVLAIVILSVLKLGIPALFVVLAVANVAVGLLIVQKTKGASSALTLHADKS